GHRHVVATLPAALDPLPHPRREDSELVPVLGHGAAGDLDALLLEDVHDRLVRERALRILLRNQLLDLRLDPPRADILARRGGQPAREEELEREYAARRLHVLLVRDPGDRGLVHVDDLGHLAERQRLEVLHALLEELALAIHDEVHDLEHGLTPLLNGLDHPVRAVQLVGDELLVLCLVLRLGPSDLPVGPRQLQPRQRRIVQEDQVLAVDLLDDQVRDDVVVRLCRVLQPRLGVELRDLVRGRLDVPWRDREILGDLGPPVVDQLVEVVRYDPVSERVFLAGILELQEQAFTQVPGADARRIEALDDAQELLRLFDPERLQVLALFGPVRAARGQPLVQPLDDLFQGTGQIPVVVDVANDLLTEEDLTGREPEELQLIVEVVRQIPRIDRDGLVVLPLLVFRPPPSGLEPVEEDLLPIDLLFLLLLFLFLLLVLARILFGGRGLLQFEERIVQQFLLDVLLQVQQRHVQEIHRLVQAWIDLHLLAELRSLVQASSDAHA